MNKVDNKILQFHRAVGKILARKDQPRNSAPIQAQADAQIGIARAAYFPSSMLSASGGFESFSASNWLTWPSRFWSLRVGAVEPIFDAGLRNVTTQQAKALYDETVAKYRQIVLVAFPKGEHELASVRISADDVRHQDVTVDNGNRNLEDTQARYMSGLSSSLDLLSAESSPISLMQTMLAFRIQQVVGNVRLIEALCGGWDASKLPKPRELR